MKRMRTKKKLIALNMGVLMLTSILIYPIFATGEQAVETTSENINVPEITQNEEQENTNLKSSTPVATSEQSRAVGDKFEANIKNIVDNVENEIPCTFKVLTLSSDGNPGTVQVEDGSYMHPSIPLNTEGRIEIPNEVSFEGASYRVTKIGTLSFSECRKITNTGLENNSSVTSIGESAYAYCTKITATGILQVKVNKKEITKISIKIEPSKVEYLEGETFAPEGLILEVGYNNGTSEEVVYEESNKEDFIFDKKELRKEDKSVKITYLGKIVELAIKVEVPAEIVVPDKGTEEKVVDTRDTMEILPYLVLSAIASVGILVSKLRKVN